VLVLEKRKFVKDVDGYNGEHEDEYVSNPFADNRQPIHPNVMQLFLVCMLDLKKI